MKSPLLQLGLATRKATSRPTEPLLHSTFYNCLPQSKNNAEQHIKNKIWTLSDYWYFHHNRPFYSYVWKRGWSWPCFDSTFILHYVNQVILMLTRIRKDNFHNKAKEVCIKTRLTSASHSWHKKARVLSPQLQNSLLSVVYIVLHAHTPSYAFNLNTATLTYV